MKQDYSKEEGADKKSYSEKPEDYSNKPADISELLDALTSEQKKKLSDIKQMLESAFQARNTASPYFSNRTYLQYFEENEKLANTTHLEQKKNPDDVVVSSGTIEQKLDSVLSQINNLNLSAEILAFDEDNNKYAELGQALEDIIHDSEIRDGADGAGDEEKRLLRQRELLKQGTVFVMEEWLTRYETKKKMKNKKYDGKFSDWEGCTEELVKVFEGPSSNLLWGPNVILGDITQFYMDNQPYIFIIIRTNYSDAKARFGKFENFKYVQKGNVEVTNATAPQTIFDATYRVNSDLAKDEVEIVIYQNQPSDEFQLSINQAPMFPIGFPLSAVTPRGKYNVAKQVYRVLSDKWAYGGSFVSAGSVKELSALIDEMLRLFVLKTRKSFTPAYVNVSGRVITSKALSPGRINMGFQPGDLQPIAGNEVQGVTAGEANILTKFQDMIDRSTVSDQFTGQSGPAGTTATEANIIQQQARLTLGLTVAACALLEKKLKYLRLYNIIQNWFEVRDERVLELDDARKTIVNIHRNITRTNVAIDGEGQGDRGVYVTDGGLPDPQSIRDSERADKKRTGTPNRKIFIDSKMMASVDFLWYVVIRSKERDSSASFKMLFKEMLGDMQMLMNFGSAPNVAGLEEEFSRIWGKQKGKLFTEKQEQPEMPGGAGDMAGAQMGRASMPAMPMASSGLSPIESST